MARVEETSRLLPVVVTGRRSLTTLNDDEWDLLLPEMRAAGMLPRLAVLARDGDELAGLPSKVQDHLAAATAQGRSNARLLRWELNRIRHVLAPLEVPVLLLKGAAYLAADLPLARGRLATDVDIMVPRDAIGVVEEALLGAGWSYDTDDAYDQHYYRTWMHELPPLRHRDRRSVLDLHHAILPPTSRLRPDPARLWEAARALSTPPFMVLAPTDMVLHSAAHLFQDGDLNMKLRDLVDISELLRHFGREADFWSDLVDRAFLLDLARPLYYALRYANRLLATPIPASATSAVASATPSPVAGAIMDHLVPRALLPRGVDRNRKSRGKATTLLYIRSHWLRMPPWLLTAHLARKAVTRSADKT
jgi:hypothetical protein